MGLPSPLPHYLLCTDTAQYFDVTLQLSRTDVLKASYGQKGSYSVINDYSALYPVNCSKQYPDVQAPRGYMIAGGYVYVCAVCGLWSTLSGLS
jgi:hypothetical protein